MRKYVLKKQDNKYKLFDKKVCGLFLKISFKKKNKKI
jgi:hypothetical protein